jgi:hypothetical protein
LIVWSISSGALENYLLVQWRNNVLPSPTPVKAAPAEHKDQHDDQNNYFGIAHGASLAIEVGGEHINICQIFQSSYGVNRYPDVPSPPTKNSICKWPANNWVKSEVWNHPLIT